MNKKEYIEKLESLKLDKKRYCIISGGVMLLYGLKDTTEDIDIKVVGLRPGEKIYEELLANDENTIKTHHEKIMIAKVNTTKCEENKTLIEELCNTSLSHTNENIVELVSKIKQIVPEFKSQNSEFEKLDKIVYEK